MEMGHEADAAMCLACRGQRAGHLPSLQWAWGWHQALRWAGPVGLGCSWVTPAPTTSLPLPHHRAQLSPSVLTSPSQAWHPALAQLPANGVRQPRAHRDLCSNPLHLAQGRPGHWQGAWLVAHSLSCLFTPWPLCHETWAQPG